MGRRAIVRAPGRATCTSCAGAAGRQQSPSATRPTSRSPSTEPRRRIAGRSRRGARPGRGGRTSSCTTISRSARRRASAANVSTGVWEMLDEAGDARVREEFVAMVGRCPSGRLAYAVRPDTRAGRGDATSRRSAWSRTGPTVSVATSRSSPRTGRRTRCGTGRRSADAVSRTTSRSATARTSSSASAIPPCRDDGWRNARRARRAEGVGRTPWRCSEPAGRSATRLHTWRSPSGTNRPNGSGRCAGHDEPVPPASIASSHVARVAAASEGSMSVDAFTPGWRSWTGWFTRSPESTARPRPNRSGRPGGRACGPARARASTRP